MRILIFGPPGAGKGTQAAKLVKRFHLNHISTGNILRGVVSDRTPIGLRAAEYMDRGQLVPDELIRELAEDAIAVGGYDRFILDGYPRTIQQAEWLSDFLMEHGVELDAVISLVVPDDVLVDRLSKRRVHRESGHIYHLEFNPPPSDIDSSLLYQRTDDEPEAVRKRLAVYHEKTQPVEDCFADHPNILRIDGAGDLEQVHRDILEVLMPEASAGLRAKAGTSF